MVNGNVGGVGSNSIAAESAGGAYWRLTGLQRILGITLGTGAFLLAVIFPVLISCGIASAADVPKRLKLAQGGPGAATNLVSKPDCDRSNPGRGIVYLHWTPASREGTEQRVAITIIRDGFERGTFDLSDPIPSSATNLVWDRPHGQAIHFWRVLTLQPEGWTSSEMARFRGPTCVQDIIAPNHPNSADPSKKNKQEGKP